MSLALDAPHRLTWSFGAIHGTKMVTAHSLTVWPAVLLLRSPEIQHVRGGCKNLRWEALEQEILLAASKCAQPRVDTDLDWQVESKYRNGT